MREVMQRQGLGMPKFALVEDEFAVTLERKKIQAVLREEAPHEEPGEDLLGMNPSQIDKSKSFNCFSKKNW